MHTILRRYAKAQGIAREIVPEISPGAHIEFAEDQQALCIQMADGLRFLSPTIRSMDGSMAMGSCPILQSRRNWANGMS